MLNQLTDPGLLEDSILDLSVIGSSNIAGKKRAMFWGDEISPTNKEDEIELLLILRALFMLKEI